MADNYTILANAMIANGTDYQQRIPAPSQGMTAQTYNALMDPLNGRYLEMFTNTLLRRISDTIVHNDGWRSPLADQKRTAARMGFSVQEIAQKWVKAHSYADETTAADLASLERPEYVQWFHSMNSQRKYKISMNRAELSQAFVTEGGLQSLVDSNVTTVMNSANYDDYISMENQIAEHAQRWGFFTWNLSAAPDTQAGMQELSVKIREFAGLWQYPSMLYNHVDVPVFAAGDQIKCYTTPKLDANLSVAFLANIFHNELADINVSRQALRSIPVDNAVALMTTSDFFLCYEVLREASSFRNPDTLSETMWYHCWDQYSTSPFVPAILFIYDSSASPGASVTLDTINYTGISMTPATANIGTGGGTSQLTIAATGTPATGDIVVAPSSATFSVALTTANATTPSTLNPLETYVDDHFVFHYQAGLIAGEVITVTATSTYINPDGSTGTFTDTSVFTVV